MRLTLLEPTGPLTPDLVHDSLGLVMEVPPRPDRMTRWTKYELLLAYDWAMREHLRAAGNLIRRRPRPLIVDLSV